ncbi:chaperonin 10-like protein [Endogone sp. FLAS-F59071]|nr:chaperonin 10-like protein [Endogone sp. FLAS-F59071]|eukprot:RUS21123.1 chaperonin 10-like protein [Endogone sp. FLAS-F59071]
MFTTKNPVATTTPQHPATSASEIMRAVEWHGKRDIRLNEARPMPRLTQPTDAIVRMTSSTICGSDLHLYHEELSGMQKGDILGHEGVGIVTEVGENVTSLKPGDRVVISAVISCGSCEYCQRGLFSCCDTTNPSKDMEEMYGHRTAALFGYSHLTGGYDGTQAEFVRVPFCDINCLKLPEDLPEEKAILLSDVACTGWHAAIECGQIKEGTGPIGLMSAIWALYAGARRVICIDNVASRLRVAKDIIGCEVINYDEHKDVVARMRELVPGGLDVAIDAVGFRYSKTLSHQVQRMLYMETDSVDVLNECVKCVKKAGTLSIIGDYAGTANGFPIGAIMEKAITIRTGQLMCQSYWRHILALFINNKVQPDPGQVLFTHNMELADTPEAYKMFDEKKDGVIKILLWNDKTRTILALKGMEE